MDEIYFVNDRGEVIDRRHNKVIAHPPAIKDARAIAQSANIARTALNAAGGKQ